MADELIDICDENNNLLDVRITKSEAHKKGLWHRASHVWIYNSRREILLQLRALGKPIYPNRWDISVAGHIYAGEDPVVSAKREVEEEIGIKLKREDLKFWKINKIKAKYKGIKNNEFCYVYFLKFDGDTSEFKLQKEEVQKVQFLSIEKIKKELKSCTGKYIPHGKYWVEVLDEVERKFC